MIAFQILPIDAQTLAGADALPGSDFEDNIQMAAAAAAGLGFVTCAMEPVLAIASSVAPAPHHLTGWRQAIQRASAVAAMRGGLIGLPQRLAGAVAELFREHDPTKLLIA